MAGFLLECMAGFVGIRKLLEKPDTFGSYIANTRGTTRAFFENEFMSRQFADTRAQIIRRLYGLLSNPTFEVGPINGR